MPKPLSQRFLTAAVVVLMAFSCSSDSKFEREPQVALDAHAIIERGYLNALIDNNSVSYFIFRGEPLGYEYELLKRFADYLHVGLKITIISGVEDAVDRLNKGEGDVIAFPLTITPERQKYVMFTDGHFSTMQVLVQKKPAGWNDAADLAEGKMIRNVADLVGKEIHVMKQSSFVDRLRELSEEFQGEIIIREDSANAETESLIRRVAAGEIEYTVTDQTLAMVNVNYFPDLDIKTEISPPQEIAWAVRMNSPLLRDTINTWLEDLKKQGTFRRIYNKYFNSPRTSLIRMQSAFSSFSGGKLSRFDETIKESAQAVDWDWRLVASIVYQESGFNPSVESWAGAMGLMQLMPATVTQFKVKNVFDPDQNIKAGVRVLKHLDGIWARSVEDPQERVKFVLASYNAGLSHVTDARNLTKKYGRDPLKWDDNVEFYLRQKTKPQFYRDPVAVAGYCRCEGPVNYVKEVLGRFEEYKLHFK